MPLCQEGLPVVGQTAIRLHLVQANNQFKRGRAHLTVRYAKEAMRWVIAIANGKMT